MIKWIVLFILLIIAFFAGDRWSRSVTNAKVNAAKAEAELAHASVDSLLLLEASWMERYKQDTIWSTHWKTKWDSITLPGTIDSIPVKTIIMIADSTIKSCRVAQATCETRVALATERADSSASEAASYKEAVDQLEKLIKGPFFRPSLEATTDFDWRPEAAFDVTAGRGHLKLLGRFVVREGAESCDFGADANTYACSTKWEGEGRVGVRYSF